MAEEGLIYEELKVTHRTLGKILQLCDMDDREHEHILRTYHLVQGAIDEVEREWSEEFNEGWKKIMSERIIKYLNK